MAKTLDAMLEPGERVVWRDPRGWLPVRWPAHLGRSCIVLGAMTAASAASTDLAVYAGAVPLGLGLAAVLASLFHVARRRTLGTLVTERRVLYRNPAMTPREGSIALTDIETVAFPPEGSVAIATRDRQVVQVTGLQAPQPFAAAVADAAGLPCPALPGPLARMEVYALYLGAGACLLLAAALFRDWVNATHGSESLADFAAGLARLLALVMASLWVGPHTACLLGLVALRHRTSAEQARTWLHWIPEEERESLWWRWLLWRSPAYVWFAGLLWGEAMEPPKEGAASHG